MFKKITLYVFINIILIISTVLIFIASTWNNISLNEIIFHMNNKLTGIDRRIIFKFCLLIFLPLLMVNIILYTNKENTKKIFAFVGFIFVVISIYFINTLDVISYLKCYNKVSLFIENNYVNPNDVEIKFNSKRNLVHIYLESMETSYADIEHGGLFHENLIPQLTEISLKNENFSGNKNKLNGARPLFGSTWTMGSMFAQNTGLPLYTPRGFENMMNTQKNFFNNIVSMGDILKKQGYTLMFLCGSDAKFAGTNIFFRQHGNYKIVDYNEMKKQKIIHSGYHVHWGIDDAKLFETSKQVLSELARERNNFAIIIVTMDTHLPGYLHNSCTTLFKNHDYRDIISCSDIQVAEFVRWIQEQDFYKNTTIVITGDHLGMNNNVFKDTVFDDKKRRSYTSYMNTAHANFKSVNFRVYSLFDNFPTILSAIGAKIQGNRLGLGTNLFSSVETLSEKYGYDFQNHQLAQRSLFMENIADLDIQPLENFKYLYEKPIEKNCLGFIDTEEQPDRNPEIDIPFKGIAISGWVLHSLEEKQIVDNIYIIKYNDRKKFKELEKLPFPVLAELFGDPLFSNSGFSTFCREIGRASCRERV